MANFHYENKFKLKQDWNWDKIIFGSDEHIYQQAYENAFEQMLEYLGISSEDELTEEHIKECEQLIKYLETPYDEGGLGMDVNGQSQTYYAYNRVIMNWMDNYIKEGLF